MMMTQNFLHNGNPAGDESYPLHSSHDRSSWPSEHGMPNTKNGGHFDEANLPRNNQIKEEGDTIEDSEAALEDTFNTFFALGQ